MIKFIENKDSDYGSRTISNVKNADVTLAFAVKKNSPGEFLTRNTAKRMSKPFMMVDPLQISNMTLVLAHLEVDKFVKMLNDAEAKSINIAGNGMSNFKEVFTQEEIDEIIFEFLEKVVKHPNLENKIEFIRTGGQTGADEAGAKASVRLGIETIVEMPKGFRARTAEKEIYGEESLDRFKIWGKGILGKYIVDWRKQNGTE